MWAEMKRRTLEEEGGAIIDSVLHEANKFS